MGLPPTRTKGSGDATPVVTFEIDAPNIPITHSGVVATIGTIPIAGGGTGQVTQTAAFNALDPLTTKGDLITNDGTNSVRQAVGTDGQTLVADSTQANGIKWATQGSFTAPRSEVWLITGGTGAASHGSTATKIRRFVTTQTNVGADITYADSATNGASFTINTTGIYTISYIDYDDGVDAPHGISNNAASLTTNITATTAPTRLAVVYSIINRLSVVCVTTKLTAGDVIRPHDDGTNDPGTDTETQFRITLVSY